MYMRSGIQLDTNIEYMYMCTFRETQTLLVTLVFVVGQNYSHVGFTPDNYSEHAAE